jgi:hypothetical protein
MDIVARWQKFCQKAEEKMSWQKKLIAVIWHNFTKSGRRNFQQYCYLLSGLLKMFTLIWRAQ